MTVGKRKTLRLSSESDALVFGVPARSAALWATESVRLVVYHSPSGNYCSIRKADWNNQRIGGKSSRWAPLVILMHPERDLLSFLSTEGVWLSVSLRAATQKNTPSWQLNLGLLHSGCSGVAMMTSQLKIFLELEWHYGVCENVFWLIDTRVLQKAATALRSIWTQYVLMRPDRPHLLLTAKASCVEEMTEVFRRRCHPEVWT